MTKPAATPPRRYTTPAAPGEERSLRSFVGEAVDGHTLTTVSRGSGVAYSTLYRHVKQKIAVGARTAMRLEKWSAGRISASKTLGIGG